MLKAYVECTREPTRWFQDPLYESELQLSGVSLTQCLINDGTPSGTAVGRTLAADMLAYAIDNPAPSIIMLISGDRHIAYPLSLLRLRRYDIVVISPSNVHAGLKSQASESFVWEHHILGGVRDAQDYHPSIPSTQNHNPTLSVRSSGPGQSTAPLGFRPAVGSQDFADGYRYKNERTYMNQTPSAFSAREQPPWTGRSEAPSPSSISFNQRNQFVRPTSIYNGSDNVHRGLPKPTMPTHINHHLCMTGDQVIPPAQKYEKNPVNPRPQITQVTLTRPEIMNWTARQTSRS
ncbi:hypothetical protein BD779DRAFT_1199707 [Infundibulicybe gibba]|nr:hypothetical protein BD779DRAFT_1199707 [Infundibulicybe gibba]